MTILEMVLAIYIIAMTVVTEIIIITNYLTSRESNISDFYKHRIHTAQPIKKKKSM